MICLFLFCALFQLPVELVLILAELSLCGLKLLLQQGDRALQLVLHVVHQVALAVQLVSELDLDVVILLDELVQFSLLFFELGLVLLAELFHLLLVVGAALVFVSVWI